MMLSVSLTAVPEARASADPIDTSELGTDVHSADPVRVTIEYAKSPGCQAFAEKSKTMIEEWYSKITDILFGPDHPLPGTSVMLICEPLKSIAYSDIHKNRIHISAEYIKAHPDDYGMVVHELTHIVQHYVKLKAEEVWLQEGIADYIRHKYFERDIANLAATVDPTKDSFRTGYRVTAAFLFWLENNSNPRVVQEINRGCSDGHCTVELFRRACGEDVDVLWSRFLRSLRTP
jgi:hypothetical protein